MVRQELATDGVNGVAIVSSMDSIQAEEVVHKGSDGEDVGGVDTGADDLESDLVVLLYHHILVQSLITGGRRVRVECHVRGYGVSGDEGGKGSHFGENPDFIHLSHDRIQDLTLEWSEDYGLVFDGIRHKSSARLDNTGADVVDSRDCDDEPMFTTTGALHLRKQLLAHGVHQMRPKVPRMQLNRVLQRNVEKHFKDKQVFTFTTD